MTDIAEATFGEFAQERRLGDRRLPIEGTLETTFRCNLRCVHCYVNEPAGAREIQESELPWLGSSC